MMKNGKLILGVVILGVAVLLLFGMLKFASILGFLMFYPYVVQQVTGYGLSPYLAQAIGVVLGAALWFVVLKLFFSWREEKRILGFGILTGFYVLHLLVMFMLPGDALVHPTTGERKFCTVDKITGRILTFEQAVFDKYGQKAAVCTTKQIERREIERQYGAEENPEVDILTVSNGFISPATGQSLFYYCNDHDGRPRFFTLTGFCPWSGGKLLSVTTEVVKVQLAKAEAERDLRAMQQRAEAVVAAEKKKQEKKILAQIKKQEREEAKKAQHALSAQIEFEHVRWGNVVHAGLFTSYYGIEFYAWETNGVAATLTDAVFRIWDMDAHDESPSQFKQKAPKVFEWKLTPPVHIDAGQNPDSCSRKRHYDECHSYVDLHSYTQFMDFTGKSWVELTLIGTDDHGHRLEYVLK